MEENKKAHMETNESRVGIYSFSQSSSKRFIANYLDKIVWICILFLIAFTILKVGYLSLYGIIILFFLCTIPILFSKIQNKFAHKIIVDFNSRKIRLHMNRSENIVKAAFDDIKSIRVNGYIIIVFKERKVLYNDLGNSNLLKCLNKIKKIEWGALCGLWGPDKNMRDALSKNLKSKC